jgi:alkylhydroperoxidase/carboxymuconolactone decarboxylase family protein YurZ
MLPGDIDKAYDNFYDTTTNSEALDERTRVIVRLASAMTYGCES